MSLPGGGEGLGVPDQHQAAVLRQGLSLPRGHAHLPEEPVLLVADPVRHLQSPKTVRRLFEGLDVDREARHVHGVETVADPAVEKSNNPAGPDDGRGDAELADQTHREEGDSSCLPDLERIN